MEVYLTAHISSLIHLTGMILQEQGSPDYSQKSLGSTLRRLVYEFDGMCDACVFALEENASLVNLKSKLTWSENFIIKSLAENPQGNMSPLNATRQYRDGYNIGLRECIMKIESIFAEQDQQN